MAKKQSFGDKLKKTSGDGTKSVKIVFTYTSPKNGEMKFAEKIIKISADENEDQRITQTIQQGRALLEAKA